jgi:phospholipid/cholesterol/gamma-HCH transport system substrate-binding protein
VKARSNPTDPESVKTASAELKVGLTMLLSLVLLISGIVWLKDMSLHQKTNRWRVTFPTAGGLSASDEVQVNGMRRGEVKSMKLLGDHVLAELDLSTDVVLTRDCVISIHDVGVMGEKVIGVALGHGGERYDVRDTIPGIYQPGLGEAMGQMGSTVDAVTGLVNDLRAVSGAINRDGRLERAIDDFSATTTQLRSVIEENRKLIRTSVTDLSASAHTAKSLTTDREVQLRKAVDDFSSAAAKLDQLSGRLDSLRATVQSVASRVDSGQGSLGKLVRDEQLYTEVKSSAASIRALIDDIKKNPKKYFKFSVF